MTTYTLEALDADGATRETMALPASVTAQHVAGAVLLRVPTSMHPDDRQKLARETHAALGKGAPLVLVIPDYVVACRLVPVEAAE